jgi:hypothetical protein
MAGFHPMDVSATITYYASNPLKVEIHSPPKLTANENQSEPTKQKHIKMKSPQIKGSRKHLNLVILALAAGLSVGCDKQKTAIDDHKEATKEAINIRKDEVNTAAKKATAQTDANAKIDKAQIEANKDSIQAQLDADKKKADAEAAAAKAKLDAENK